MAIARVFEGLGWTSEQYDQLMDEDRRLFRLAAERLAFKPLISILLPVYNTKPAHLERGRGRARTHGPGAGSTTSAR